MDHHREGRPSREVPRTHAHAQDADRRTNRRAGTRYRDRQGAWPARLDLRMPRRAAQTVVSRRSEEDPPHPTRSRPVTTRLTDQVLANVHGDMSRGADLDPMNNQFMAEVL